MRRLAILFGALALFAVSVFPTSPAQANCVVTGTETFVAGTYVPDDKCGLSGGKKIEISGGDVGASATATAASPSYTEGYTNAALSVDLNGNLRTTMGTLLSCEDQTNNLCMTSGGAVRQTSLASAVTTNTTSAAFLVPTGVKTFYGQVVGTGAVTQTQALYCDIDSDAANGILLGTLTLSGTTRDQAIIPRTDLPCSYMYLTTTNTTGTSAAGAIYAQY